MDDEELIKELLRIFYRVYGKLGCGFLEKVYENTMILELTRNNIMYKSQCPIKAYYDNFVVGDYVAIL